MFLLQFYDSPVNMSNMTALIFLQKSNENSLQEEINLIMKKTSSSFGIKQPTDKKSGNIFIQFSLHIYSQSVWAESVLTLRTRPQYPSKTETLFYATTKTTKCRRFPNDSTTSIYHLHCRMVQGAITEGQGPATTDSRAYIHVIKRGWLLHPFSNKCISSTLSHASATLKVYLQAEGWLY